MNEDLCFAMSEPDRRTMWQRFVSWTIPFKMATLPSTDEIGFDCEDVIHVETFTTFSLWERLKILVFGTVSTTALVMTEHKPGKTYTALSTYISTESREKKFLGIK